MLTGVRIVHYLERKESCSTKPKEEDDVDKFLGSMAATMKKFPERVKAEVKFKIHQIIHQAEMDVMYPGPTMPMSMPLPMQMQMSPHNLSVAPQNGMSMMEGESFTAQLSMPTT